MFLFTFSDIGFYGDICSLLKGVWDICTCLFTSRDMGYRSFDIYRYFPVYKSLLFQWQSRPDAFQPFLLSVPHLKLRPKTESRSKIIVKKTSIFTLQNTPICLEVDFTICVCVG